MALLELATGVGQGLADAGTPSELADYSGKHTIEVTTTGAPTAVVISIEGSLSGVDYKSLDEYIFAAADITDGFALYHFTDRPVQYLRANVTTLTGGTAPTVTIVAKVV